MSQKDWTCHFIFQFNFPTARSIPGYVYKDIRSIKLRPKIEIIRKTKAGKEMKMKNINELNLKDLESVAGGFTRDQLTPAEWDRLRELYYYLCVGRSRKEIGKITDGELKKLEDEYYSYSNFLQNKYGDPVEDD